MLVFEPLQEERGLPDVLYTDNGREFLSEVFAGWCQANGLFLDNIEPEKPIRMPISNASTKACALGNSQFKTMIAQKLARATSGGSLDC